MQILGPNSIVSAAFIVAAGKQVTLSAHGLSGDDVVVIEIVTLSSAPEFKGDPCCDLQKANIEVISAVPLKCPDGTLVTMTAEYPFVVLDGPQLVTMRARVIAGPDATITVDLNESDSDGCTLCACRTKPCEDTDWAPSGKERCVGTNVEREEISNCGTPRWVVDRPQTWTDTGKTRCSATDVEKEQANDCGKTKWVVDRPLTWTDTGNTRCENHLVEKQQANDCGVLRWFVTTLTCGYCPSLRLSCDGQPGYGFHIDDPKDPAATVEMAPCPGDTSVDSVWIYPSSGPGHTFKVRDCDGNLIGYAANRSDCAPDCGCPGDPVINITNKFNPTTNVAAPVVNVEAPDVSITLPAPTLVAHRINDNGSVTSTLSDGSTVVSNPLPSC